MISGSAQEHLPQSGLGGVRWRLGLAPRRRPSHPQHCVKLQNMGDLSYVSMKIPTSCEHLRNKTYNLFRGSCGGGKGAGNHTKIQLIENKTFREASAAIASCF